MTSACQRARSALIMIPTKDRQSACSFNQTRIPTRLLAHQALKPCWPNNWHAAFGSRKRTAHKLHKTFITRARECLISDRATTTPWLKLC